MIYAAEEVKTGLNYFFWYLTGMPFSSSSKPKSNNWSHSQLPRLGIVFFANVCASKMSKKYQDPMKAREIVHSQMTRNDEIWNPLLATFLGFFSKLPHLSIKYKYSCTIIQSRKSLLWNQPKNKIMGSTLPPQSSSYLHQQNHRQSKLSITMHYSRGILSKLPLLICWET